MKLLSFILLLLASQLSIASSCGEVVPAKKVKEFGIETYWGHPVHDGHHLYVRFPESIDKQPLMHVSVLWGTFNDYSMSATIYNNDIYPKTKVFSDFVSVRDTERQQIHFQAIYGNCLYVLNEFEKL
jgi:hypothetical protein